MSERSYTEGELTQWLETTGITPRPDYVDDLLTQTARSRQRSAWRFPERWLPMDLTARAPTITGRQVPLRLIGLVALVVLALVVGATLLVASQRRLPAPFGPAANGLIVYAAPTDPSWVDTPDFQRPQGDIFTVDPSTGTPQCSWAAQPSTATRSCRWTAPAWLLSARTSLARRSTSWIRREATHGR